jgi:4-hydroxythreonine-4-phosphate dehydrogenase
LRTRSEACHRAAQEDASNCLSQQGDVSENRGILILVATREPIGTRQVTALAATTDAAVSQISIGQAAVSAWLKHELPTLRQRLANGGVVVLTLSPTDPDGSCEPEYAKFVVGAGLALRGTSQLLGLFATGGETARQLLDALGVRSARVITEIEPGMVELRTSPGGLRIVTKAGSFGTECSLIEAVNALRST